MIEVRPFAGTPEELSDFVIAAWESTYAGKMSVPHWNADYFRWQLRLDEENSRKRLVCVYQDDQPAGVVLFFPVEFEVRGERFRGAQASWLSVPAQRRGQGIARLLNDAVQTQMRDDGLRFRLGFGYSGSKVSAGPGFWKKLRGISSTIPCRVGFWVRVLDSKRAAAWNVNRWEGWLARIGRPLLPRLTVRKPSGVAIRPVQQDDVPRCMELAEQGTRHCDLRLIWDEDRLARQLGLSGFGKALVAEEGGEVRGCIGWHVLPIAGRTVELVGVLDLVFVSELSAVGRTELLNSVLIQMQAEGAIMALKLRSGDYPNRLFLRLGWFCKAADSDVIITWAESPQPLPKLRRLHVLWR
ncbi:MAG: GNAT family N-acetyltransferase [Planctomycetaceae bacterium]